ncbi:S8 family peptidase [Paenibacillus shunpengii]|uniref:S8 family peptidase n=1 Tax=Paenibacillus shunpengii TaxID=2054424 RepID=A0ABW5SS95_9BACL|nr:MULTISPECIES: S8 family peptidase [unclassified Paenibacillus]OMC68996.1 peptidase S8 [Paenibacillus sp. FSL H7-0326]SDX07807.1 Subtilase family protein [Paenibacillus sp. PDC88]
MARSNWTYWAIGAAAAVLVMTTLLLPGEENTADQQQTPNEPQQEQLLKQRIKAQDVQATDRLSRMDAQMHLQKILQELKDSDNKELSAYMDQLEKTHSHIHTLLWMDLEQNKQQSFSIQKNADSLQKNKQLRASIGSAKQALQKHKSYESTSLTLDKDKYFVLGEPSSDGKHAVIAVMSQHILNDVEEHQRRNLRMIPYPKEGMYSVESVLPNTLKDITVKTGHDNQNASHFYEDEIVVRFNEKLTSEKLKQIEKDIDLDHTHQVGQAYVFRSKKMDFAKLQSYFQNKWNPVYTEPHYLYLTNETAPENELADNIPNDLLFSRYQWNLPATETNKGWTLSKGSEDVIVAVIDTGVDLDHPDLEGQLVEGYNVIDGEAEPYDDVGHGTHVAGIVSAKVNNNEGVAGMTWYNKIMPVKVLDQSGSGTSYAVAEGIIWATDHGAKVINMSLGNYADAEFLHDAIKYAYDHDVVLIAATGNDNTERPGYPAAYPEVFAVSATDASMKRADFSNYGDYVDVMAPGASIASTYPGNQYAALSGTSMASPHVAALAGLIRSYNPDLSNEEVMDLMRSSVIDLGDPGYDKYFGYGQIDVYKALEAAGASGEQAPLQLWPQNVRDKLEDTINRFMK